VKKKKAGRNWTPLVYSLMSITLLVFSFASYSLSSTISMSFSYKSAQQVKAEAITPQLTSSRDPSYSVAFQHYRTSTVATLPNSFLTYENPKYGITIQYPSSWEKIEYPRIGLGAVGNDLVANFLAPLVNASDHWREHVMIQVLNQSQAKKLIPQSDTTLAGRHAYKRVDNTAMAISSLDTNTTQRLQLKTMEVWVTIANGDTFLLNYKAAAARYSDYLPTIQEIFDSFKIWSSTVSHNSTTY
jgi:hypothetical protein